MRLSTQDPISHAEGDVWTHTRMVVEALVADPEWRERSPDRRAVLFWAAILHDVAKPQTRTEEDGRIRNPGHSIKGAQMARSILWEGGIGHDLREQVCTIIVMHQSPFWLIERPEWKARWTIARTALTCHPDDVRLHAVADARGRICPDLAGLLDNIALYGVAVDELEARFPGVAFPNDEARVRYFDDPESRAITDHPPDVRGFEVVVMSGLPGSGKSTLAREIAGDRPVLSLDALRTEMGIDPTDNQGTVIQRAQESARAFLRKRQSFVWDSTNLTRDQRQRVLGLVHAYGARSRIVAVERSFAETMKGNSERGDATVPMKDIRRMMARWEPPTLAECHSLEVRS